MQWNLAAKMLSLSRRGCIATWKLIAAKRQTWQRRRLSEASHERHRRAGSESRATSIGDINYEKNGLRLEPTTTAAVLDAVLAPLLRSSQAEDLPEKKPARTPRPLYPGLGKHLLFIKRRKNSQHLFHLRGDR